MKTKSKNQIRVRPLGNRVVVEPIKADESTPGGIVLPDVAQEKTKKGLVIDVGPGKQTEHGLIPVAVKPGDTVAFLSYAAIEQIEHNGETLFVIREDDICAVIE